MLILAIQYFLGFFYIFVCPASLKCASNTDDFHGSYTSLVLFIICSNSTVGL